MASPAEPGVLDLKAEAQKVRDVPSTADFWTIQIVGAYRGPLLAGGTIPLGLTYLGTCFATIGRRNYTFTAWTSPEAAQVALRGDAHSAAMKHAQSGGFGENARGTTSMWTPHFLNGVFRPGGASLDLSELGGQWL